MSYNVGSPEADYNLAQAQADASNQEESPEFTKMMTKQKSMASQVYGPMSGSNK